MEKKELKLNIAISECACKNYIVHLSCHVLQQQLLFFKTVHVKVKFILEKKKKIYQSLVGHSSWNIFLGIKLSQYLFLGFDCMMLSFPAMGGEYTHLSNSYSQAHWY